MQQDENVRTKSRSATILLILPFALFVQGCRENQNDLVLVSRDAEAITLSILASEMLLMQEVGSNYEIAAAFAANGTAADDPLDSEDPYDLKLRAIIAEVDVLRENIEHRRERYGVETGEIDARVPGQIIIRRFDGYSVVTTCIPDSAAVVIALTEQLGEREDEAANRFAERIANALRLVDMASQISVDPNGGLDGELRRLSSTEEGLATFLSQAASEAGEPLLRIPPLKTLQLVDREGSLLCTVTSNSQGGWSTEWSVPW